MAGKPDLSLTHFQVETDQDGVATVLMDVQGDKVNTLSPKVASDMAKILEWLVSDSEVKAVVLGSAKRDNFVAGADIELLHGLTSASDAARLSMDTQDVFAEVEQLHREHHKPVVAAIDGAVLGGGLELALACSIRLISDSPRTVLGQPEIKLGVIPGGGGTQRLPRLIGVANALDLILTGKNVRGKKALQLGLADEMVPASVLLAVAKARALAAASGHAAGGKSPLARLKQAAKNAASPAFLQQLALERNPVGLRVLFKKAHDSLIAQTRGNYPAPERALEVVRIGILEGLEAGYAAEADRFGQLAVSSQAKALMSIFLASRELKKETGVSDASVRAHSVAKIGMLGGGLMGGGIAVVSAREAGVPVRIKEIDDAGILRGLRYVRKVLDGDVKRRRLMPNAADRLMSFVTASTDFTGWRSVDLVVEAVFEDLEIKRKVLKEVEEATSPETIFASNTSSIPITQIAEASAHPETVIGMHYFSPVEKMPLVEIITTEQTAPWVTATCVSLGKAQGKTVIVVNDGTGFYTSRIISPYMNEAAWLLTEGASIEALDGALMDFGFPVGPLTLLDEVGIDVAGKVAHILDAQFGERMRAPPAIQALHKDERRGRKNGRGFYHYEAGKKCGVDATVYQLLGESAGRRSFKKEEIQKRLALMMCNEAARCLEEGILHSARDGDVGAIFGLGFPPFLGGPFTYMDTLGASSVVSELEAYAKKHGPRFEPAQILRERARAGAKFRS